MSARKFGAARRRKEERERQDVEQAADLLKAQLRDWTSDRMVLRKSPYKIREELEEEDREWFASQPPLKAAETAAGNASLETEDEEMPLSTPPKKRNDFVLERADTPVMSNASHPSKGKLSEPPPAHFPASPLTPPVASPFVPPAFTPMVATTTNTSPHFASEARRYHQATLHYLNSARTQSKEYHTELTFLHTLRNISLDRLTQQQQYKMNERTEANFWGLLLHLRSLLEDSADALILEDVDYVKREHSREIHQFMDSLAGNTKYTPLSLCKALQSHKGNDEENDPSSPMPIRRRYAILQWLHECFQGIVQEDTTRPRSGRRVLGESHLFQNQGLLETEADKEVLDRALLLVLAGRTKDAKQLAQESGIGWRAASWEGGAPHGYTLIANDDTKSLDRKQVGNVRRFLWKHYMWKKLERMEQKGDRMKSAINMGQSIDSDRAITALLCNHFRSALDNPMLCSWEKGIYAAFSCVVGRTEDLLIHMHHSRLRHLRPPFPGTEYEEEEKAHLQNTADFSILDDSKIIQEIERSPFPEMQCADPITQATAAFIAGRSSICAYFDIARANIALGDEPFLRFACHLAIYLDALANSSNPKILSGAANWIEFVLVSYIRLLKEKDLLEYIVLYVSFLPDESVSDKFEGNMRQVFLPELFADVQEEKLRKLLVEQMKDLLPIENECDIVIEKIVENALEKQDSMDAPGIITEDDTSKINSLKWLSFNEDDIGASIWYTNALIRQFVLAGKRNSFFLLMDDCRTDFLKKVVSNEVMDEGSDDYVKDKYKPIYDSCLDEHFAYEALLVAWKAQRGWDEFAQFQSPTESLVDDPIDSLALSEDSRSVSREMLRNDFKRLKRDSMEKFVKMSLETLEDLKVVLHFNSGWLCFDWGESLGSKSPKYLDRSKEMEKLRKKIVPALVLQYLEVCVDTAQWLDDSTNHYADTYDLSFESARNELCSVLDEQSVEEFHPLHWKNEGMAITEWMDPASELKIRSCFSEEQLVELTKRIDDLKASMV